MKKKANKKTIKKILAHETKKVYLQNSSKFHVHELQNASFLNKTTYQLDNVEIDQETLKNFPTTKWKVFS